MELPTSRELELETLLRQRDAQLAELTDEVAHLRQYLSSQSNPNVTDPISLPPPLVSLLLPLINSRESAATSSSDTVVVALTQRTKVLQEENDELYELLKTGETGRLKEDVRSLRRVVHKLEGALRESHQVISSLSEELEKSQATIVSGGRSGSHNDAHSQSPVLRTNHQSSSHSNPPTNGGGKPPPTAPRAHKKPRLSETQSSTVSGLQHAKGNRSQNNPSRRRGTPPDRSPRVSNDRRLKMEVDEDDRPQSRSPEHARESDRDREKERNTDRDRDRERPRERERDRHRERDRDRDRDRVRGRDHERSSKRNGAYGGSTGGGGGGGGSGGGGSGGGAGSGSSAGTGGRRPRRGSNSNSYASADRTLAERMGL